MYKKVILPLDGSKLAEAAIPHLENIAKGCAIPDVILVSVTERIRGRMGQPVMVARGPGEEYRTPSSGMPLLVGSTYSGTAYSGPHTSGADAEAGKMANSAWNYLSRTADRLKEKGLNARPQVLVGGAAEEIIRFAKSEGADLIVMASRGRTGFNRWQLGSVADKVIRAVDIPVVLVKPKRGAKETKPKRKGD